ncbi:hypothetical protein [Marinospirillum alkaliphilum]
MIWLKGSSMYFMVNLVFKIT